MQNPKNVDINAIFEYPYFWEDGISSASDIYSIIPQTTAKIIPNIRSLNIKMQLMHQGVQPYQIRRHILWPYICFW